MRRVIAICSICAMVTGCATTTADPNYLAQLSSYQLTISSQREVEVARAKAEEARYVAMATIAERSDPQTKSMALFALALSGRGVDTHSPTVPVQLPRIPENPEDRWLKWAAVIVPTVSNIALAGFSYSLGRTQSDNQAATTQSSYNALVAMKPAQPPFVPTTSTTTVNNITSSTDLYNRDGFVNVGGAGQNAPTTATQDNSPPPAIIVPPVFSPVPVTPVVTP